MIVLFGTDGSDIAHNAIREAARLLPLATADLYIVSVAPIFAPPVEVGVGGLAGAASAAQGLVIDQLERNAGAHLDAAAKVFTELGLAATPLERIGDPVEEILATAHELGADMIVVGSHGYGLVQRLLLGSVSRALAHRAPNAVLVVRPKP